MKSFSEGWITKMGLFLYSDRHKLGKQFEKWAKENKAAIVPENVITWLHIEGLLNESKIKEHLKKCTKADIQSAMVTNFEQFKDVCTKFFQKHNPMIKEGNGLTFIVLYNIFLGHNVFYCKFVRDEKEYSLKYDGISWDVIDDHKTLSTALTLTGCFSKAFLGGE